MKLAVLTTILLTVAVACEPNAVRRPSQEAIPAPNADDNGNNNTPPPTSSSTQLSTEQVKSALLKAGFPQNEIQTMLCIGWCESGFNPKARGDNGEPNDAARYDWGLFQINGVNLKGCSLTSGQQLYDVEKNAKCAYNVRKSSGFGAWTVYKSCKQPPTDPKKARCS